VKKWKGVLTGILICFGIFMCANVLTGCSIESNDEKKLGEVDFTVVPEESIPVELKTIIDERKKDMFKTTFIDNDSLYIIIGYGSQPTGGYSIGVSELYETKNGIYVKTEFLGPSKNEVVSQMVTYPYIVIKLDYIDKSVVFK
jgi:hypothetical protein